jgi:N-acetylmuramoyl-L-alanine amidase
LRETKAPAVLIEIGFIDNSRDNALFDSKRSDIVKGIAKAIIAHLGIEYMEENNSQDKLAEALDILVNNGVVSSPAYWLENAQAGKTVNGEYAGLLIERMAEYISSQQH